jgi:hypothetical protein
MTHYAAILKQHTPCPIVPFQNVLSVFPKDGGVYNDPIVGPAADLLYTGTWLHTVGRCAVKPVSSA